MGSLQVEFALMSTNIEISLNEAQHAALVTASEFLANLPIAHARKVEERDTMTDKPSYPPAPSPQPGNPGHERGGIPRPRPTPSPVPAPKPREETL